MIKKKIYEKNAPQARSFYEIKYATGKTEQTKCAGRPNSAIES